MSNDKKTVITISDHPFSPSGVGTQTKHFIESMLETGEYRFLSLGGAIRHNDYTPSKTEKWGEDWVVVPVDGYGTKEFIRHLLATEKPDALWIMTDPRFWGWLWAMDNEIRTNVPIIYYHVWDNYPFPTFNQKYYESNDYIATISKVTDDIVANVAPSVKRKYIPHSVDSDVFCSLSETETNDFRKASFGDDNKKFTVLWNNRNARRKQSGSLIFWFKEFLDIVGHDNARMIMHTEPNDPNGQDLMAIMKSLNLLDGQIMLSTEKMPQPSLARMYNIADVTINVSDAEGFGLATLESLSCGTPIIVTMTGGLQEQVTDGEDWFGIGIEASSKAIIGSQEVPWIYEDRLNKEDVVNALVKMYNMTEKERVDLGAKGRKHVLKNYNPEDCKQKWIELMNEVTGDMGSWENRKGYDNWTMEKIA